MSDSDELTTVSVEAHRESPTRTAVEARDFDLTVDEPEEMGGDDEGANPLEYLLVGQAGCLNVTATQVAEDVGIEIDDLDIDIRADFSEAAFAGHGEGRPGLRDFEVTMRVETDADDETVAEWTEQVEERCPVTDNVENESSVAVSSERV